VEAQHQEIECAQLRLPRDSVSDKHRRQSGYGLRCDSHRRRAGRLRRRHPRRAAGIETALVEREHLGGVCLNWGCIPSKALLQRGKEFGFSFDNLKLDYSVAHKRSRQVSDRLVKGTQFLMKKNKIDVYQGSAKLRSTTKVDVTSVSDAPAVNG